MTKIIIHAASFGSEGPPHDEGLPIGKQTLELWGKFCRRGGADTYDYYTPSILNTPEDGWCVKRYDDSLIMPWNPGYHKVGLGAWRSVILRKMMDKAKDGDVVVVHCSNFPKYPDMKFFAENLRRYVEKVLTFTDFFMPPHVRLGTYCSRQDLKFLIPDDDPFIESILEAPLGRARLIIAKVTPKTREFARIFEETLKKNPELLFQTGKTGYGIGRFDNVVAEQSIVNILAFREGLFPREWQGTWMTRLRNVGLEPGCGVKEIL